MKTYTALKEFVANPHFQQQKQKAQDKLERIAIDAPIAGLIHTLNGFSFCFTLQCCHGHFVYDGQNDPHNMLPLPQTAILTPIEYRIGYITCCIENSQEGKELFQKLHKMTGLAPENIQFCCADWFWEQQVNSFVLQVEPDRFKHQDKAVIGHEEALHLERVRNNLFNTLYKSIKAIKNG